MSGLIFPMWVLIARLDTEATAAADPVKGGYHPVWREPRPVVASPGTATAERTLTTQFMPPIALRAQIERGTWQRQRQGPGGNVPDTRLSIVLSARDIERQGLVDANGETVLKVGDKITGIYTSCGRATEMIGSQTQDIRDVPGLKCVEVTPAGEGLGGKRNLFVMTFEPDDHGILRG